jgi:hypothetical protein
MTAKAVKYKPKKTVILTRPVRRRQMHLLLDRERHAFGYAEPAGYIGSIRYIVTDEISLISMRG